MNITLTPEECRKAIVEYLAKKNFIVNENYIVFELSTDRFEGMNFDGCSVEIKDNVYDR